MLRLVCAGRGLSGRSFSTFVRTTSSLSLAAGFWALPGLGASGQVRAASFDITTNTTAAETLSSTNDTGTVAAGVTLTYSADTSTPTVTVTGTDTSLTNYGTISQTNPGGGRAVRVNQKGVSFTLTNADGAVISAAGDDAFQSNKDASVTIYNSGTIESLGGGQAIDLNAVTSGTNEVYNYSTGLIEAFGADALRPGVNGYVYNAGTIKSENVPGNATGNDGIDAQSNSGVTIDNAGLIDGARHGITGGNTDTTTNGAYAMTITNEIGGQITGEDGSGINIDGFNGNELATITNHGTITGNGITGDGDGVDVDGLVYLINSGTIKSTQAYNDVSEGVTVGGGTIINSGTIEGDNINGGDSHGITLAGIDKDSSGNPIPTEGIYADTTVTNSGLIRGETGSAIAVTGAANAFTVEIDNLAGGIIEGGGTEAAIYTGGNDATIVNYGTIEADGTGDAIDLGSGNSAVQILGGSAKVNGNMDGGSGTSTLLIAPGAGNSFTYDDVISDFSSVEIGEGTITLNGANTYAGTTMVDDGGTLAGIGTVSTTIVDDGGTLQPGSGGNPGTLTINGDLTFSADSIYRVAIGAATEVSGEAILNNASLVLTSGNTINVGEKYTILTAADGISGTFDASGTFYSYEVLTSYNADDVFLTFSYGNLALPMGASANVMRIANALDAAVAENPNTQLPSAFNTLFALTPQQLQTNLAQLTGEPATGAQEGAFRMENSFLSLLLDPFAGGREGGSDGFGAASSTGALAYSAESQAQMPAYLADAYAQALPALKGPPPALVYTPHWDAWAAPFGGGAFTAGDANTGSHNTSTTAAGFAAGADYHLAPGALIGLALAGGGTGWSLGSGFGSGHSTVFQSGLYGITQFGNAYLAGAFAFGNYWIKTNRLVGLGDGGTLDSSFTAQGYGGRIEAGYHVPLTAVTFTPYAAVQPQVFTSPAFSEFATSGSSNYALAYNSESSTQVRGELGTWANTTLALDAGRSLNLFGRTAWAHDWQSNPNLDASFLTLPAASFVVEGAKPPANLALTTLGATLDLTGGWSLTAKFDGEFGKGAQSYAGTGRLAYTW
ncbi:hypothetical protein CWB41_06375 [Methylovirgula ligni]|uniref:Outer membrane autotransporter protein n=1 Tax=Methylovirgula ligni TaxID=569860 RepID=A0A3D9Z280_9HYPH|nr:autotransporter domain-containing protein [Methylovirgula ligni]QAY95404.1 hypothetical protein CWB41_06375 [Methylovirgula ligni]REF89274.1 outer membrane autotransporter protein [Methylovirgula ligni]